MTLAEIARLAGVSRTTASYVINGKSRQRRISDATVARVMAVVESHGYQVDARAAALRSGVTRTLGFILPDLENTSYARLAKLIEQGARRAGYQLLIASSGDDRDTERELAATLQARRCDALIVASALPADDPLYPRLIDEGLPVVAVDRALDERCIRSIISENRVTASRLTASVVDDDTRHVLWLDAVATLGNTLERRAGFEAAVAATASQPMAYKLCGEHYERDSGAALMAQHLARHGLPQALVSASRTLLDGALDVLLQHFSMNQLIDSGPKLATFGNDRLLDFLPLGINAMQQNHERIAERVLHHTLEAIAGQAQPGRVEVPRQLIIRHRPAGAPLV
ncbi:catabolite repressor/activator [Kushneria aurantia]|uniref:Catabolite repressor/activator n=1 Tax=Kushneria aurantia TaxID=504092 RepID=A0ABV6G265_9GAMM|nr:catabolite repressor/activator [Kushneria aurantia]